MSEQQNGVWACRHKLKGAPYTDCHHFIERNSKLIADRYEPVTSDMCVRVNCVQQLQLIRAYLYQSYHKQVQQRFHSQLMSLFGSNNKQNPQQQQSTMVLLFQQFKMELYKLKCLNKDVELRLSRHLSGVLNLLVYRVYFKINYKDICFLFNYSLYFDL
jgi:hypothetical protein